VHGLTLEYLRKPTENWNSAELLDGDIIKAGDIEHADLGTGRERIPKMTPEYLIDSFIPRRKFNGGWLRVD
jgi:hypothetical protein